MIHTIVVRCLFLLLAAILLQGTAPGAGSGDSSKGNSSAKTAPTLDPRFSVKDLIYSSDFNTDLADWKSELESGGSVALRANALDIDVPAGATVWLAKPLDGHLLIQYQATVIKAGGMNDRVSDLNCFWMARDSRNPADLFAVHRTGKFADYNRLLTYYVGQGGNGNTTTRFRRYIGDPVQRPLRPQDDLHDPADLLQPNVPQTIQLVACGGLIQYYRDGKKVFELEDTAPYTSGWFGLRTTKNHMRIEKLRIFSLSPTTPATQR